MKKKTKAKKKASLTEIDRMLGAMAESEAEARTEEEALATTLDAWGTVGPPDAEDLVYVPHVVRRTFGTAYAPLELVVAALRAAGAPELTVTDSERRTIRLSRASYTLRPGADDMLPWPSAREAELVKALVTENDIGQHGLLPTRAAWSLVFG